MQELVVKHTGLVVGTASRKGARIYVYRVSQKSAPLYTIESNFRAMSLKIGVYSTVQSVSKKHPFSNFGQKARR